MTSRDIVVGLNSSPGAAGALRWAAEEARLRRAPLRIVHTWDVPAVEAMTARADLREATEAEAAELALGWAEAALGTSELPGTLEIVHGEPARVLVEASRDAALLVLGTQEHVGLRRLVAGSVSHYCLAHAECAVVAVPGSPARRQAVPRPRVDEGSWQQSPGPLL